MFDTIMSDQYIANNKDHNPTYNENILIRYSHIFYL